MSEQVMPFVVWCVVAVIIMGIGVSAYFSKKPVGFWANTDVCDVTDVSKYNHAVAKLFWAFSVVMILCGLPLLSKQNSGLIIISIVGVMFAAIATMAVYTTVIEKKYRRKDS